MNLNELREDIEKYQKKLATLDRSNPEYDSIEFHLLERQEKYDLILKSQEIERRRYASVER